MIDNELLYHSTIDDYCYYQQKKMLNENVILYKGIIFFFLGKSELIGKLF